MERWQLEGFAPGAPSPKGRRRKIRSGAGRIRKKKARGVRGGEKASEALTKKVKKRERSVDHPFHLKKGRSPSRSNVKVQATYKGGCNEATGDVRPRTKEG